MLLQHATVRSIFLLLQTDTSALVPKQHLHSGNVSQLHRVKGRSSGNIEMAVDYKTGTPLFPPVHFLKAFADKEFANLVLLTTVMLLGITQI